jgi:carboxylesterase type B
MTAIISLATDIAYYAPAVSFARSFQGKTSYYHFNEPNPWNGIFKGQSTHLLDAAFLFQNFNEHLPVQAQDVAKSLASDFIRFANGVTPWPEFTAKNGEVRAYGPSTIRAAENIDRNGWGNGRRETLFKLAEEGVVDLDQLSVAWNLFVAGK